jgi:hypothetical protein
MTPDFYPAPTALIQRFSIHTAAVYGCLYCSAQPQGGICTVTLQEIGAALKLHRATIARHIELLEQAALVRDLTPGLPNHPHTFAVMELDGVWRGTGWLAEAGAVWHSILPGVNRRLGRAVMDQAACHCTPLAWDGHTLRLGLANPYVANLFKRLIQPVIEDQMQKRYPGSKVDLVLVRASGLVRDLGADRQALDLLGGSALGLAPRSA